MAFPEIMKFLVVDADKDNINYLRSVLVSLGCEVTMCNYRQQALSLLHDQKCGGFDIVLADVNRPYEHAYKFLELVRMKTNLPIIMMCSVSDKEIVSACKNLGTCEVAVKPFGIDDVRRFWQYAVTQRRQRLLGVGNLASSSERFHDQDKGSNEVMIKRQLYKNRLVWTEDLKALFVEAVNALGGKDVAVPMKIMERMNVPELTRRNIASHLQKYRLYSDPNYLGGKRKRKASQAMQVNGIDEKSPVVAHPNRHVLSFVAPEFGPEAQNASTQQQFGQIEGKSRGSQGMNSDSTQVNGIVGYGNQQGAYFKEQEITQFPVMPESDTVQQLYGSTNVQPYVPEPPAEPVMMKGMAVPEVFGDSCGPSLPSQSSFELQVPSDGIRSEETPTTPDPELESFLAADLSDLNFQFFDKYLPQDMSMIYGGLSNRLHDNNYLVEQSEMGNGNLSALNDRIRNEPATDSLIMGNPEANNSMAMHYPQNIPATGGIVDHSNSPGLQQQGQIGGTSLKQTGSLSGLGTRGPSPFGQGTRNSDVWFWQKPPGAS